MVQVYPTGQVNVLDFWHPDMYVSSLRSYIEAVGVQLKIVAEFPEGEVVTNYSLAGEVDCRPEHPKIIGNGFPSTTIYLHPPLATILAKTFAR